MGRIFVRKDKPTVEDVHVNRPLTSISVAYLMDNNQFVAPQVFPAIPGLLNQTDSYFVYNKDDFRRNNLIKRPPSTESAGVGYRLDATNTYYAHVYSLHKDISDQVRNNSDDPLQPDNDAALFLAQTLAIGREKLFADNYFTTGVWGTDNALSGTEWSTAGSDPEADVDTAKLTILKNTGMRANTMVVGFETHQTLKQHALVQERFKYTSAESITAEMLARFFEIDRYLVAAASYNAAAEEATADNQLLLGDKALVCYVNPNPSLYAPSAGYTFPWSRYTGLNDLGIRTKRFRMEHLESDRVEVSMSFDMKVVSSDCGYFFSNTVA